MNERIKQLMLESGYDTPEMADSAQKFTELVVNTCIEKIKYRVRQFDMDDFEARCVIADIKKEFGVT